MNEDHAAGSYNPNRYACHICNGSLKGKACRSHDNCMCCEDCFVLYCASKCHVCNIPITEEHLKYVKVGDKTFHTKCYVCCSCNGSLQGKGCQMFEGRMYDTQCYATVCAPLCNSCHKPIKGNNVKFIKENNKCYHARCYRCYLCHRTLQGISHFTAENNMRLCVQCLTN